MGTPALSARRNLALVTSVASFAIGAAALAMAPPALRGMFSSSNFLPHAVCYLYNKQLIALHVGSDAVIWLSYVSISCTLVYLVWRTRRDIPFSWMFLAFGLFIVACGFTHLMEVIVLWKPLYWLAGDVKLVTALASIVTAIALPGLVPQVRTMINDVHLSEDRRRQIETVNADLQRISAQSIRVQDAERRRIARELHDGIGQYLAAIKMSCEVALGELSNGDGSAALQDSLDSLDRCATEVRTMSHLLHPPLLEEMGLASAVPWYVEGFSQRSGIRVDLKMASVFDRLPGPVELALFRILQESLTNIHRHSGSKIAKIGLRVTDSQVLLTVEDNGKGLGPDTGESVRPGVGIASMRERVRELGGEFLITSETTGAKIQVTLPILQEVGCPSAFSS